MWPSTSDQYSCQGLASDGCGATYWNHRLTLARLAATEQTWKDNFIKRMADACANFEKCSKGAAMIDEYRWTSGPRACAYYRNVEFISEDTAADKRLARPTIVNFTWEKAQGLATSRPATPCHSKPCAHPDGADMTNERTVHASL